MGVPELCALPDRWIHRPWSAPAQVLAAPGVVLGEHYPLSLWSIVIGTQRGTYRARCGQYITLRNGAFGDFA
jgi:hypothetical protein